MASGMATRCPACSTIFRVVPDQLRVSEGWVRCGRCGEVFNAAERLVDLDTGVSRRGAGDVGSDDENPPLATPAQASDFVGLTATAAPAAPVVAPEPVIARAQAGGGRAAAAAAPARDAGPDSRDDEPRDLAGPVPSFVRRAQRAERWRAPRVRTALLLLGGVAVIGLGGQVSYEYRDLVAARMPFTRPALEQACTLLGCRVGPPRAIESLAVDSSGLVRVEKSNLYKLNVALRNRAGIEVALPALELTLTDVQGRLLARRVLRPGELGVTQATVAAGRELGLQATLQAATDPVAGYTIELFYP